jgi:hypothetical protein
VRLQRGSFGRQIENAAPAVVAPIRGIGFALLLPAYISNLRDHMITGVVSEAVVDRFEPIDIKIGPATLAAEPVDICSIPFRRARGNAAD